MPNKNKLKNNQIQQNDISRFFWDMGIQTIQELETPKGILASDRSEIFGCIFGRDSLISCLKLIKAHQLKNDAYFLALAKKIIRNLIDLQGKEINIESGEEPGKCIHEFREDNHDHLTKHASRPWHVYPDGKMRIFDSIDATPLLLIAIYRYLQESGDKDFIVSILPEIKLSLNWILEYGDKNNDGFIDYQLHPERRSGGLVVQSWMDSAESLFHEDGSPVYFPIAPVEVQAYCFLALKLWSRYFKNGNLKLSSLLLERAVRLKNDFNEKFILKNDIASGIDGKGKPLMALRSSIGHILWASLNEKSDGKREAVVEGKHIPLIVDKLMSWELFETKAGIRTLGKKSSRFEPNSYHNGSIWPHDNSIIADGLENFGFHAQAMTLRNSILRTFIHFKTPLELFVFDGSHREYRSPQGQLACKKQAWSTASMLLETQKLRRYNGN